MRHLLRQLPPPLFSTIRVLHSFVYSVARNGLLLSLNRISPCTRPSLTVFLATPCRHRNLFAHLLVSVYERRRSAGAFAEQHFTRHGASAVHHRRHPRHLLSGKICSAVHPWSTALRVSAFAFGAGTRSASSAILFHSTVLAGRSLGSWRRGAGAAAPSL
jgi:hypothetical protein